MAISVTATGAATSVSPPRERESAYLRLRRKHDAFWKIDHDANSGDISHGEDIASALTDNEMTVERLSRRLYSIVVSADGRRKFVSPLAPASFRAAMSPSPRGPSPVPKVSNGPFTQIQPEPRQLAKRRHEEEVEHSTPLRRPNKPIPLKSATRCSPSYGSETSSCRNEPLRRPMGTVPDRPTHLNKSGERCGRTIRPLRKPKGPIPERPTPVKNGDKHVLRPLRNPIGPIPDRLTAATNGDNRSTHSHTIEPHRKPVPVKKCKKEKMPPVPEKRPTSTPAVRNAPRTINPPVASPTNPILASGVSLPRRIVLPVGGASSSALRNFADESPFALRRMLKDLLDKELAVFTYTRNDAGGWKCVFNTEDFNKTVYFSDGADQDTLRKSVSGAVLSDLFGHVDPDTESQFQSRMLKTAYKFRVRILPGEVVAKLHVGRHKLLVGSGADASMAKKDAKAKLLSDMRSR